MTTAANVGIRRPAGSISGSSCGVAAGVKSARPSIGRIVAPGSVGSSCAASWHAGRVSTTCYNCPNRMATPVPRALVTAEELFERPDGQRYELVAGGLVRMPPSGARHSAVAGIARLLDEHADAHDLGSAVRPVFPFVNVQSPFGTGSSVGWLPRRRSRRRRTGARNAGFHVPQAPLLGSSRRDRAGGVRSRRRRNGGRAAGAGRLAGRDARPGGGRGARHGVRRTAGRSAVAPHRRVRQDALLRGLRHRPRSGLRGGERRLLQRAVRVSQAGHGARGRPRPAARPPEAARRRSADGHVQRGSRVRGAAARRGRRLL